MQKQMMGSWKRLKKKDVKAQKLKNTSKRDQLTGLRVQK